MTMHTCGTFQNILESIKEKIFAMEEYGIVSSWQSKEESRTQIFMYGKKYLDIRISMRMFQSWIFWLEQFGMLPQGHVIV